MKKIGTLNMKKEIYIVQNVSGQTVQDGTTMKYTHHHCCLLPSSSIILTADAAQLDLTLFQEMVLSIFWLIISLRCGVLQALRPKYMKIFADSFYSYKFSCYFSQFSLSGTKQNGFLDKDEEPEQ